MKKYWITTSLAAIAFAIASTSCGGSGEHDPENPDLPGPQEPQNPKRTEIILSTTLQAQTRAAFPDADTQLPAWQTVSVWVHEATKSAPQLYGRNVLTANGSGALSGDTMYFPQNDNDVHIYALHANTTLTGSAYPAERLTHTVASDQREADDYALSDLLYARKTNVKKSEEVVPLVFYHLLSKLQVAVVLSGDLIGMSVESVTLCNTKLQAGYTLERTAEPSAIAIVPGGTPMSIEIGNDLSTDFSNPRYNDAIIVPQTLTESTPFIMVRLTGGAEFCYTLPEDVIFESGKKYLYHITLSQTELNVSTSIQDWTAGGIVEGDAELVE